ncbi:WhiB family transcriptional regulator [Saccharopolyspora sp. ASAGF58]|nr:WhiB family transcriptional regulator [Saccharopolyspora sp. ASAGF58]QIZ37911.1 WhiB family transcriptional regulator [Saccharopolyspora sp. ASAGF58]
MLQNSVTSAATNPNATSRGHANGDHSPRVLLDRIYRYGRCVETRDPDAWYFRGDSCGKDFELLQRSDARSLCADCSVRTECLRVALLQEADAGSCWGVWGGTSARDRAQALNRARRQGVDPADIVDDLMAWLIWITDWSAAPRRRQRRHRPPDTSGDRAESTRQRPAA